MVNVETETAVYVRLGNQPGELARAAKALGDRRINVSGLSAETLDGGGYLRLVVTRPDEAIEALRAAGIDAHPSEVVVPNLPNRAGALARAAAELAAAGINVEGVVTTADKRLAFRTSDNERAAQILGKL